MAEVVGRVPAAPDGRLADNVAHFVRALRRAGLPLGPGHALRATEALRAIEIADRKQFYWALHASLVARPEERELLFLAEVEGYSAREIGEITERPRGSVLSALHRAKGKLRKRLGDEAKEGTA